MESPVYLTTAELAERHKVKPQTIRLKRTRGGGPPYIRIGGCRGRVLYSLEDVEAWEKERRFFNTSEEAA